MFGSWLRHLKLTAIWLLASFFLCQPAVADSPAGPLATLLAPGTEVHTGSVQFEWTSVPDAQAYYLWVGTKVDGKDLVDSGELQRTSYVWSGVPAPQRLHIALHTLHGGVWRSIRYEIDVVDSPPAEPVATLLSPGPEVGPGSMRFEWTQVPGAQAYYLWVGRSVGSNDLVNSGELQRTYQGWNGGSVGQRLYVALHTLHGGVWRSVRYEIEVVGIASLVHPAGENAVLAPSATLTWAEVPDASAYYLAVGSVEGARDVLDTGEIQRTYASIAALPRGVPLHARLYTLWNGVWRHRDRRFMIMPVSTFVSPATEGAELAPGASITWAALPEAQAYYLTVGNAPGGRDLLDSGEMQALSRGIGNLPRGPLLHARLYTLFDGKWRFTDRTFRISSVATFLQPLSDQEWDVHSPVQWTSVPGAEAYYLYLGSSPGGKDLLNSGETPATSRSVAHLPVGITVHATLHTKHSGVWRAVQQSFVTRPVAYLSSPAPGTAAMSNGDWLQWTTVPTATRYFVWLGSAPGLADVYSSGEMSVTQLRLLSQQIPALAHDRVLHLRLHTLAGGKWRSVDYVFDWMARAVLTAPAQSLEVDVSRVHMAWSGAADADRWRLTLGSTPGQSDVMDSGELSVEEAEAVVLPAGRSLHARVWSRIGGEWRHSDSILNTRGVSPLLQPLHGDSGVAAQQFQWGDVPGADAYRLEIGRLHGGTDVYESGLLQALSVDVPFLPDDTDLHARVWARVNGRWRASDSVFTTREAPRGTNMEWQGDPATLHARDGMRWSRNPLARSYRLRLGTGPGTSDLLDTGDTRTTMQLVEDLPVGVPLFGRIETRFIDGSASAEDFTFEVAEAEIGFSERLALAMQATADVRGHASTADNLPARETLLYERVRSRAVDTANCTDYTDALFQALTHAGLGISARALNVCLNTNSFDCHTLLEVLQPGSGEWLMLDPTFGTSVLRAETGQFASAADMFDALHAEAFEDVEYLPMVPESVEILDAYYLDYPLLFANVYRPNVSEGLALQAPSISWFYESLGFAPVLSEGFYAVRCPGGSAVEARADGSDWPPGTEVGTVMISCTPGQEGMSRIFFATSLAPVDGEPAFEVFRARRYVFH